MNTDTEDRAESQKVAASALTGKHIGQRVRLRIKYGRGQIEAVVSGVVRSISQSADSVELYLSATLSNGNVTTEVSVTPRDTVTVYE